MDNDGAFSHKKDYVTFFVEILNPEGHSNSITGSKVMAILLNLLILPVVGVTSGRVCAQPANQACSCKRTYYSIFSNESLLFGKEYVAPFQVYLS